MGRYRLRYHRDVVDRDLPRLDSSIRKRIRAAIEHKLVDHPEHFAKPLAHTTQRLWALRVGDWRVIFALRQEELWILKIGHRRDVYSSLRYPEVREEHWVSEPKDSKQQPKSAVGPRPELLTVDRVGRPLENYDISEFP